MNWFTKLFKKKEDPKIEVKEKMKKAEEKIRYPSTSKISVSTKKYSDSKNNRSSNSDDLLNPLNPLSPISPFSIWNTDNSSNNSRHDDYYSPSKHDSWSSSDDSSSNDSSNYDSGSYDSGSSDSGCSSGD